MANSKIVAIEDFLEVSNPEIQISSENLAYIQEIVKQCKYEVSWVMEVEEVPNFIYQIQKVFIPPQEVHETTTEFEGGNIMELCEAEPTFNPEKWRGWGHSHVNMGVSPSDQDRQQMMKFSKSCPDFFVGMIHNKSGEVFCWLIDNKRKIFFRDVYLNIINPSHKEVESLIKDRVKLLKRKIVTYDYTKNYFPPNATRNPSTITPVGKTVFIQGSRVTKAQKKLPGFTSPVYGFEVNGEFIEAKTPQKAYDIYIKSIRDCLTNEIPF